MKLLTLLFILNYLFVVMGQWIDPHSMDSKAKNKLPNVPQKTQYTEPEVMLLMNCDADVHLRRIVRLVLANAYLESDMGYFEGHINLKLSTKEHQFLINFSKATDPQKGVSFSEVSSILENALQKPSLDKYHELVLTFQERIYELIFNPTSLALVGACLILYILYKLMKAQFTWKLIIKYFLIVCYVFDAVIIYLDILRDREIDTMVTIKTKGIAPPECSPENMSWWTYAKTQFESTFFENPCKAYYQTTFDNYKYLVAPSKVLVRQFRTIIEPVGDIGEAFGKFGRGMFTSLPWGLNMVLFPVMLIVSLVTFFIILIFMTKPQFKLSLFRLFTVELGHPAQNQPLPRRREIEYEEDGAVRRRRRNGNDAREVGFRSQHRALVEDVSNSSRGSGHTEPQEVRRPNNEQDDKCKTNLENDGASVNNSNNSAEPQEVRRPNNEKDDKCETNLENDGASVSGSSSSESFVKVS